jgi:[ribosomal protein S18]-alanine N-acetyltransferase
LSGIELRPCRFQDLGRVEIIEQNSFTYRPYSRSDFIWFLTRVPSGFIVACVNDSPVGYVIAFGQPGGNGMIQSIAVLPEFRGRRIGEELMRAALDILASCKRIELLVEKGNESAIGLYRKLGFIETATIIERYYGERDAVEFVREKGVTSQDA